MATLKKFEELTVWQSARTQCINMHTLIVNTPLKNDFALRDQMVRSSGSVMDNIAEGFDRFTKADFRHFLVIARGSNAELRSQLYRVKDKNYSDEETVNELIQTNSYLSVKLTNLINHLSSSSYKQKPAPFENTTVSETDISWQKALDIIPEDFYTR